MIEFLFAVALGVGSVVLTTISIGNLVDKKEEKGYDISISTYNIDELKSNGRVSGRTDDGKLVFVEGSEELLGQIVDVKITKTSRGALDGVLI